MFHGYVNLPEGNLFYSCCIIMCYLCSRGVQKVVFLKVILMLHDILLVYVDTVSLFIYLTALPSSSTASKRSRAAKSYTLRSMVVLRLLGSKWLKNSPEKLWIKNLGMNIGIYMVIPQKTDPYPNINYGKQPPTWDMDGYWMSLCPSVGRCFGLFPCISRFDAGFGW